MTTPNINVKKDVFEPSCGLSFEDINGGDKLHNDVEASEAAIAKARAGLKLFSLGGILV